MEIPIAWKVNNVRFDFAGSYVFERGQNREFAPYIHHKWFKEDDLRKDKPF